MDETCRPLVLRSGLVLDSLAEAPVKGDLLVRDGLIARIGPPGMDAPEGSEEIDASRRLIIPGLVNSHTHSHLAWSKGVSKAWTLELHLHNGPWTGGGQTLSDRRLLARFAAAEMLLKGCTACYDLVLEMPCPTPEGLSETAHGYEDAGMRALVAPMMADRTFWRAIPGLMDALPPSLRPEVESIVLSEHEVALAACREAAEGWSHDPDRAGLALAPTIPLHCSDAFWQGCRELADEFGLRIHAHIAESRVQALSGRSVYGRSLVSHLDALGIVDERFTAAHAIWLEPGDRELLARRGATVAHNPSSNFRLGSGIADVPALIGAGARVGLGTDTCSCSDHLNLFETMRLAAYLPRVASPDPDEWLSPRRVLEMATAGGAAALGMERKLGRIAEGFCADLVLLDLDALTYAPLNDAVAQLVFGEEGRAVDRVLVGGRTVVEAGRLTTLDLPALVAEVRDRAAAHREALAPRRAALAALEPFVKHFCVGLSRRHAESGRAVPKT